LNNTVGFGFLHDGSVDSLARFLNEPVFNVTSDQMTANLVALMLAFAGGDFGNPLPFEPPGVASLHTHASVGRQTTLISAAAPEPGQLQLITDMINLANQNRVGLVVKGLSGGIQRGWRYNGANVFQSDRTGVTITAAALQASAAAGGELTYLLVPKGSETRIGIDRDADGFFDRDEIDQCSDPADASSTPGNPSTDIDGDQDEDFADLSAFVAVLIDEPFSPPHVARCDLNCDDIANGLDVQKQRLACGVRPLREKLRTEYTFALYHRAEFDTMIGRCGNGTTIERFGDDLVIKVEKIARLQAGHERLFTLPDNLVPPLMRQAEVLRRRSLAEFKSRCPTMHDAQSGMFVLVAQDIEQQVHPPRHREHRTTCINCSEQGADHVCIAQGRDGAAIALHIWQDEFRGAMNFAGTGERGRLRAELVKNLSKRRGVKTVAIENGEHVCLPANSVCCD
jgi:hypothetical protein